MFSFKPLIHNALMMVMVYSLSKCPPISLYPSLSLSLSLYLSLSSHSLSLPPSLHPLSHTNTHTHQCISFLSFFVEICLDKFPLPYQFQFIEIIIALMNTYTIANDLGVIIVKLTRIVQ